MALKHPSTRPIQIFFFVHNFQSKTDAKQDSIPWELFIRVVNTSLYTCTITLHVIRVQTADLIEKKEKKTTFFQFIVGQHKWFNQIE